jgi:hypothetical protein
MRLAVATALPFALMFVAQTLAVRSVILRVRGGGNAAAAQTTARLALGVAAVGLAIFALLAVRGRVSWVAPSAAVPGALSAAYLALFPPPPTRLRTVGWALVSASVATALWVAAAVRF